MPPEVSEERIVVVVVEPLDGRFHRAVTDRLVVPLNRPHLGDGQIVHDREETILAIDEDSLHDRVAMLQLAAEEEVTQLGVHGDAAAGFREGGEFLGQFGADPLVGIQQEDPVMAERQGVQRPLLLLRVLPVPHVGDRLRPHFFGDLHGPVRALGVDDEHLAEPVERARQSGSETSSSFVMTMTEIGMSRGISCCWVMTTSAARVPF